jgi:CRP-like cAMP-binding protein
MISTLERVLILKGTAIFGRVYGEALLPLARLAEEVYVDDGERLIRQGEEGDGLFVLVEGRVRIVVSGREVAQRGSGDVIGEMAVLRRGLRSADCFADGPVTALRIDHDLFWELLDSHPELAQGVLRVLADRLEQAQLARSLEAGR